MLNIQERSQIESRDGSGVKVLGESLNKVNSENHDCSKYSLSEIS